MSTKVINDVDKRIADKLMRRKKLLN